MENRERAGAGAVGSAGSLGLRVGQAVFSSASLLFMSVGVEFFSYTTFCNGLGDPLELYTRHDRRVLHTCRVPSSGTRCHGHCRHRRLGPGNTFTSSCQLKCGGHRSSAPIPWISLLSQILWEVSAVGDDGFLVLVPNGRFLTLQPLVHRLPVTTADC
ncbi:uncharacterized protein LOC127767533 isoform X2 [Oryza glaberrima]|uniref:uncharacterized protein LOC127767533 isoform X2 n=1 Tax=Oryza glaberrima TaxID=4538 RepID=UPI00224C45BA|nr:uncharacterized protein LOC127767533 isoform X2 [Oryza glaberrima]